MQWQRKKRTGEQRYPVCYVANVCRAQTHIYTHLVFTAWTMWFFEKKSHAFWSWNLSLWPGLACQNKALSRFICNKCISATFSSYLTDTVHKVLARMKLDHTATILNGKANPESQERETPSSVSFLSCLIDKCLLSDNFCWLNMLNCTWNSIKVG